MAIKGGRVEKPEEDFQRLLQQSKEIEREAERLYKMVDKTVSELKRLNKGVLTDWTNRVINKEDYQDLDREIVRIRHELEEELRLAQTEFEKDVRQYKEGALEYCTTFKNLCKRPAMSKEKYFEPKPNGPYNKFLGPINYAHNAGQEEMFLIEKAKVYDRFTRKLETELKAVDEKLAKAENSLENGKPPEQVAKSFYNHVSRYLETFGEHDLWGLKSIIRRMEEVELDDYEDNYKTYSEERETGLKHKVGALLSPN